MRLGIGGCGRVTGYQQRVPVEVLPAIELLVQGSASDSGSNLPTLDINVPAGDNRYMVVCLQWFGEGITSNYENYGGTNLTLLEFAEVGSYHMRMFGLVAPALGNEAVQSSLLDDIQEEAITSWSMYVAVFKNVDQVNPVAGEVEHTGTSSTVTASHTAAAAANVVVGFFAVNNANADVSAAVASSQTLVATRQNGSGSSRSRHGMSWRTGTGALNWTLGASKAWANIIEELAQSPV